MRRKNILLVFILLITITLSETVHVNYIQAATTYPTCALTSKAVKNDDKKLSLKDGKIIAQKGKKSETIAENVEQAFLSNNEICYKSGAAFKIYSFKTGSTCDVNVAMPNAAVNQKDTILTGFVYNRIFYLEKSQTKCLYQYDEKKLELIPLIDTNLGTIDKTYLIGTEIFAKQDSTQDRTSLGPLTKYNYNTGKQENILDNVSSAYLTSSTIYYCTYGDLKNTLGVGSVKIAKCNLSGKDKKQIVTIDNVDTKGYTIVTSKAFIYLGKDGKYHKYTFSKKKTTDYSQYKAEELMKKAAVCHLFIKISIR